MSIISKVDIENELTKGRAYSIQSAIYCDMIKVINNQGHDKFYSMSYFENLGK